MSIRPAGRAGRAAALVVLVVLVAWSATVLPSPALAAAGPPAAAPGPVGGGFTSPSATTPVTTGTPPLSGHLQVNGCVSSIDLTVTPMEGQADPRARVTIAGNGKSVQDFTWPDGSRPVLAANGRYKAVATATFRPTGPLGCVGQGDTAGSIEQSFGVAVPPVVPADVATRLDSAARLVTVTWTANREPDLLGYSVRRIALGGPACPPVAPQDATVRAADRSPFSDAFGAGDPAGPYCYWVAALRTGATSGQSVASADSPPVKVTVPGVAADGAGGSSGSSGPAAGGAGQGAAGGPAASGAPANGADFNALLGKAAHPAAKPGKPAEAPDTGFSTRLPFQVPPDGPEVDATPATADAAAVGTVELREAGAGTDIRGPAAFAAGLLVLVLAGHLLLLRREVNRAVALEPEPV